MHLDPHGIPYLKDEHIEFQAYELLAAASPSSLKAPCCTSIPEILRYLQQQEGVRIAFANLGFRGNARIVGRTILSKRMMCFDRSITPHGANEDTEKLFWQVGAHETGHIKLHCGLAIKREGAEPPPDALEIFERDHLGRKKLQTPYDWLEHQAKVYAGALLVPRQTLTVAVAAVQKEMGITRNRGLVYLDDQPVNQKDFAELVRALQHLYFTSAATITVRLQQCGLVEDHCRNRSSLSHIGEVMRESIPGVFENYLKRDQQALEDRNDW